MATTNRPAGNPAFQALTRDQVERIERNTWYHSIRLHDGTVIQGLIPLESLEARVKGFPIPQDLSGKRVLDVGAATGWCSFEMERRGAEVVAVDCVEYEDFYTAKKLLGSRVEYRVLDMEEMTPETLGVFDYALFFGVLYHLRHPLLGLERLCALTRDTAYVESFVSDSHLSAEERAGMTCTMEFYEIDELGGQIDNWVGPTTNCLLAFCRSAGFARVDLEYMQDRRAGVVCRRRWEPAPENPRQPDPWINAAVNNRTQDIYFHPPKDEYICLYFKTPEPGLGREDVRIEVDGYGAPVLLVTDLGRQGWQANLRVPPGLAPGPHGVRVRTVSSALSNVFQIVIGDGGPAACTSPAADGVGAAPELYEVENSMTETSVFHGFRNEYLCARFKLDRHDLAREEVLLEVGGMPAVVRFLTNLGDGWQVNAKLPDNLKPGTHAVRVRAAGSELSNPLEITLAG
jgi:tRNA (mo5U34)-methyltransferase